MPRRSENAAITGQEVLACLARKSFPASLHEIAAALDLRHAGRRDLKKIIAQLKRKKEIEEVRQGRFRVAGARGEIRSGDRAEKSSQAVAARTKQRATAGFPGGSP